MRKIVPETTRIRRTMQTVIPHSISTKTFPAKMVDLIRLPITRTHQTSCKTMKIININLASFYE